MPAMLQLSKPGQVVGEDGPADVHGVGALADDESVLGDDALQRRENGVVVERHRHVLRHFVGRQLVLSTLISQHWKRAFGNQEKKKLNGIQTRDLNVCFSLMPGK